ncbi:cytochrome P450 [Cercophora newfieldiana]|uniref:Cytochrome P450 n=1 Tax=Cercophora newfieldiana TaxID=92897 RepID=A0AA39YC06_9PEZI|nr:cytochrome P450 [Cercophora newfieldiana]
MGPNVIAAVNGPLWKSLHHMMGPSFSPVTVKAQIPTIVEHATVFHEKLRQAVETGKPFSLVDLTTSDVISAMVLGFSLQAQNNGCSPLLEDYKTLFSLAQPYMDAWNPLTKFKLWRTMRGARKRTDAYVHKELQSKYRLYRGSDAVPTRKTARSVLDRMVVQKIEETGDAAPYLDQAFLKLVTPNLNGLLAGGQGTTADALTYTYLLLSLHPAILSRLRSEHASLFPPTLTDTTTHMLSHPHLTSSSSLPYTTAILKETLRLFPAGFTPREAPPDTSHLHFNGTSYPVAGKMVIPNQHALHFDSTHFLPDRSLEEYEPKAHRFTWRPFERGLRSCIRQEMAMEEMRTALVLTVRWFDLEPDLEGVKGKGEGKVRFSDLDEVVGDAAWQEMGLGASPRGEVWMRGWYRGELGGDGGEVGDGEE